MTPVIPTISLTVKNCVFIRVHHFTGKTVIPFCAHGGGGFDLFINKNMMEQKELLGKVEFNFSNEETIIPDRLFIDVKLQDEATSGSISHDKRNILASTWNFNIPIDKKKLETMKVVYNLNQNIEIDGQRILFKTVTITPTRISAEIEYDKSNSKKILGYDDIEIVNEKGEKWATIMNGVTGTRKDDDHQTLFFQSNYFTNPKELYIKGSSIKSLGKDKLKVIVDVDKKVLLKAPDDKLTLKSVTAIKGKTSLEFQLLKDKILDKDKGYFVFQYDFEDSEGNVIHNKANGGTHLNGTDRQDIDYIITTDSKFKNPISLTVWDYPIRIKGDFKVKIK